MTSLRNLFPGYWIDRVTDAVPLNAMRVFVAVARDLSVTNGARALGMSQSAASRHVAILERYLGARLIERRGRSIALTSFGKLLLDSVSEPLESILFTADRMRREAPKSNALTLRTSVPTLAYSVIIPRLAEFNQIEHDALVHLTTSLAEPSSSERFDVLITRDLHLAHAADEWKLMDETVACIGAPNLIADRSLKDIIEGTPFMTISSRPDVLPLWCRTHGLSPSDLRMSARFDHHYLAIPALLSGQCVLIAPQIYFADLLLSEQLLALNDTRVKTGMNYRAYSIDRSEKLSLSHEFCRWTARICRHVDESISALSEAS